MVVPNRYRDIAIDIVQSRAAIEFATKLSHVHETMIVQGQGQGQGQVYVHMAVSLSSKPRHSEEY